MVLQVPVESDFFECPPLTAHEVESLRIYAKESAIDMIEHVKLTGGPVDWTLHSNEENVHIYRARDEQNIPMFSAHTEIEATLDEIRSIFLVTSTEEIREYLPDFYPSILDTVRLYNLTLPTPEAPHRIVSINWALLATMMKGVIYKNRDFSYIQYQDDVTINGRRAWIRSVKHIDIAACPNLEAKYGIIRGQPIHFGHLYIESERPGYIHVIEIHHIRSGGMVKGPVGDYLKAKSTENLFRVQRKLGQLIRSYQLRHMTYLPEAALVPKHSRSKCSVCLAMFSSFNKKSNCRRCGEVVCVKVCSTEWDLKISGVRVNVRICQPCSSKRLSMPAIDGPTASLDSPVSTLFTDVAVDNFSYITESTIMTAKPSNATMYSDWEQGNDLNTPMSDLDTPKEIRHDQPFGTYFRH